MGNPTIRELIFKLLGQLYPGDYSCHVGGKPRRIANPDGLPTSVEKHPRLHLAGCDADGALGEPFLQRSNLTDLESIRVAGAGVDGRPQERSLRKSGLGNPVAHSLVTTRLVHHCADVDDLESTREYLECGGGPRPKRRCEASPIGERFTTFHERVIDVDHEQFRLGRPNEDAAVVACYLFRILYLSMTH